MSMEYNGVINEIRKWYQNEIIGNNDMTIKIIILDNTMSNHYEWLKLINALNIKSDRMIQLIIFYDLGLIR